jgi:hypothetical protein
MPPGDVRHGMVTDWASRLIPWLNIGPQAEQSENERLAGRWLKRFEEKNTAAGDTKAEKKDD